MNTRLSAFLFTALFLIGVFPLLCAQPFGAASAGITAGFMLPAQDMYHVTFCVCIGLLSAWLGEKAILLLPLCMLLMMTVGGLMEVSDHSFPPVHGFILGAIILFAMCVSMLRTLSILLCIPPIAVFAYFAGGDFMQHVPGITTPLFFLMGITVCSALLAAIGVALGVTLHDHMRESVVRFKNAAAFASFLSLF